MRYSASSVPPPLTEQQRTPAAAAPAAAPAAAMPLPAPSVAPTTLPTEVELVDLVTRTRTALGLPLDGSGPLGDGPSDAASPASAPAAEPPAVCGDVEEGLEGDACWICFSGPRDAVLLECGHGGICHDCAVRCARKRPPLCPMCRQRITRVVQLAGAEEEVDGELVVELGAKSETVRDLRSL